LTQISSHQACLPQLEEALGQEEVEEMETVEEMVEDVETEVEGVEERLGE